jgi:hypothetical protein
VLSFNCCGSLPRSAQLTSRASSRTHDTVILLLACLNALSAEDLADRFSELTVGRMRSPEHLKHPPRLTHRLPAAVVAGSQVLAVVYFAHFAFLRCSQECRCCPRQQSGVSRHDVVLTTSFFVWALGTVGSGDGFGGTISS